MPTHLDSSPQSSPLPALPLDQEPVVHLSICGPRTNTRRAEGPSGPAGSIASSLAAFCPFLLLTKRRCPDVLGTQISVVFGAGKAFSPSPLQHVLRELRMWCLLSPREMLPLKWENLPAPMPSYKEVRSEPMSRTPTFWAPGRGAAEATAGRARGQVWWPPQGASLRCRKCSSRGDTLRDSPAISLQTVTF